MLILESTPKEKRLVLGDYMTVYVLAADENQTHLGSPRDAEVKHAAFFQRITKQRGEFIEALAA